MTTISINRGEVTPIPFAINDSANGLAGKRVTCAFALQLGGAPVLAKASGLPGSSAAVTITAQTAAQITGTVNLAAADFNTLTEAAYYASLWTDDGAGNDHCVTPGGADLVQIVKPVKRT